MAAGLCQQSACLSEGYVVLLDGEVICNSVNFKYEFLKEPKTYP